FRKTSSSGAQQYQSMLWMICILEHIKQRQMTVGNGSMTIGISPDTIIFQEIIAPGFPTPDIPCEYELVVEANHVVQLEILALEANPNFDFLEIYEGAIGKN
ncbi:hypothetical protein PFISCL1PPCAC_17709, partial [Pristionchus fissidentatus]